MSITLPEALQLPQRGVGEALGTGLGAGLQTGASEVLKSMLLQKREQAKAMSDYQKLQTELREKELFQKQEKEEERTEEWRYAQHKDFRKEVTENYRDALETDMRLNRMQELNNTGALTAPATALILDKVGLPISILGNPDSEEFDKLSRDLLKNIRTYFGARINVVEVENFLKTIPKLTNSQEGRNRVINNLKLLLEPRKLMFDEYRKMRSESQAAGKSLPIDLEEVVLERIKPQLDDLSARFEAGSSQEIGPTIAPETREFEKMPSPIDYAGVIIEDDKGRRYKSDGKKWRKL